MVDRIATVDGPFPEIQEVTSEQYNHLEDPLTRNVKCVYVSESKWGERLKICWEWWFGTAVETAVRTENEADRKIEAAVGKRFDEQLNLHWDSKKLQWGNEWKQLEQELA